MPYYRAPAERPRQPKRFLTSRDVEDMAAAGRTEIVHADDLVITDAARETAQDLGLRIVQPEQQEPAVKPAAVQQPQAQMKPHPVVAQPVLRTQPALSSGDVPVSRTDPLVHALVKAVRSNLPALASLAGKG